MFSILYLAYSLLIFWIIRTAKAVLFWIYLWQLKEYHIGRFLDHFRTTKGKLALFNKTNGLKVFFLILFIAGYSLDKGFLIWALLGLWILYILESFKALKDFLQKKAKKPVFTKKVILIFFIVIVLLLIAINASFESLLEPTLFLLLFDLLTPIIISIIVLLVQPLFVYFRMNILREAKEKIARYKNLTVIGITGSYGKTSTKEFLTTILSSKFSVLATPEHKNSEMGIAETILKELKSEHKIFVVEMGAYNKDGIRLLCKVVKPTIGMVTGVNEQHLSTFRSMENLLSAEGGRELLQELPQDGLLVVNGDNKHCLDLYKMANISKKIYTLHNDKVESDIWAEEITVHRDSLDFLAIIEERETFHFNVSVLGRQNIQNLLGSILVAKELGMSLEEISLAAKNIRPEQAGTTRKTGINGINIIDSSYSSNPDGVVADLDYLSIFEGKKVIVMPCLIELGNKSGEVHQQIGKKIADICNLAVITTKDKFEEIKMGAVGNGMEENSIIFSENPKEIFNIITTSFSSGDAVLLEGRVPSGVIKLLVKS